MTTSFDGNNEPLKRNAFLQMLKFEETEVPL